MEDKNMTIEESFEKLESIVSALEGKDIPLEEAFAKYKEGIGLVKECNDMIDKVEKEISTINASGEMGLLDNGCE